tara:strand:+ start:548 stop:958 length:411 start_codon:yes stop_codon:yes gene_type:complete
MVLFYYCKSINEFTFNEKIDVHKKNKYIELFSLMKKGNIKEYWLNNVHIMNDQYYSEIDTSYEYKEGFLIHSFQKDIIPHFNFYKADIEYEYILYENKINDIIIRLKIFDNYITLEFENDSINDFFDFIKQKKYIL